MRLEHVVRSPASGSAGAQQLQRAHACAAQPAQRRAFACGSCRPHPEEGLWLHIAVHGSASCLLVEGRHMDCAVVIMSMQAPAGPCLPQVRLRA